MATGTRTTGQLSASVTSLLRRRIGDMNVSRAEVGRRAGIDASVVSRILSDKTPIYLEQLDALCAATGLEVGELLDAADRESRGRVPTMHALTGRVGDGGVVIAAAEVMPQGESEPGTGASRGNGRAGRD